jgi:hypothetical protein
MGVPKERVYPNKPLTLQQLKAYRKKYGASDKTL